MDLKLMKKVVVFVAQVLVATIVYTALLYLWYLFDHGEKEFDRSLLVQGLVFSIIYVLFSNWWNKRRRK